MSIVRALGATLLIAIGVATASCGGSASALEAVQWRSYRSERLGIAIRYPATWTIAELDGALVLSAAPFRPSQYRFSHNADRLPAGGGLLELFEYPGLLADARYEADFPPRPSRFRLKGSLFGPYEGYGPSYLLRFRETGRAFQAMVATGEGHRARLLVERVLDSLRVETLRGGG
jgi:hypothetical protein